LERKLSSTIHRCPDKDKNFEGREDVLLRMQEILEEDKESPVKKLVITGLSGVGKTSLVLAYVWKGKREKRYDNSFFIYSDTNEALGASFQEIAAKAEISFSKDESIDVFYEALRKKGRTLLVFDNVNDLEEIRLYLPPEDRGYTGEDFCIVLTSIDQISFPESEFDQIALYPDDPQWVEDSVKLVRRQLPKSEDINDIRDLTVKLQYLPLALAQAVAYIKFNRRLGINLKKYLLMLDKVQIRKEVFSYQQIDRLDRSKYGKTVLNTWLISWENLSSEARHFLSCLAFIYPHRISLSFIEKFPMPTQAIRMELFGHSLISSIEDSVGDIKIHSLVQEVIRYYLESKDFLSISNTLISAISSYIYFRMMDVEPAMESQAHYDYLTKHKLNELPKNDQMIRILYCLAQYLRNHLRDNAAAQEKIILAKNIIEERMELLDHPYGYRVMSLLSKTYAGTGELTKAKFYNAILQEYEKRLGKDSYSSKLDDSDRLTKEKRYEESLAAAKEVYDAIPLEHYLYSRACRTYANRLASKIRYFIKKFNAIDLELVRQGAACYRREAKLKILRKTDEDIMFLTRQTHDLYAEAIDADIDYDEDKYVVVGIQNYLNYVLDCDNENKTAIFVLLNYLMHYSVFLRRATFKQDFYDAIKYVVEIFLQFLPDLKQSNIYKDCCNFLEDGRKFIEENFPKSSEEVAFFAHIRTGLIQRDVRAAPEGDLVSKTLAKRLHQNTLAAKELETESEVERPRIRKRLIRGLNRHKMKTLQKENDMEDSEDLGVDVSQQETGNDEIIARQLQEEEIERNLAILGYLRTSPKALSLPDVVATAEGVHEIDVPHDGSCLFYAVVFSVLLPLLDDSQAFSAMYLKLFGGKNRAGLENMKQLLTVYDGSLEFVDSHPEIKVLIDENFRQRLVDYMKRNEEDFQSYYDDDETFTDCMKKMLRPGTWGGEREIQGISEFLGVAIRQYATEVGGPKYKRTYGEGKFQHEINLVYTTASDNPSAPKNHYHYLIDSRYLRGKSAHKRKQLESGEPENPTALVFYEGGEIRLTEDQVLNAVLKHTISNPLAVTDPDQWVNVHAPEQQLLLQISRNSSDERILSTLNRNLELKHKTDQYGNNPFHWIMMAGRASLIRSFKRLAVKAKEPNKFGLSPFHMAVVFNQCSALKQLIQQLGSSNHKAKVIYTSLAGKSYELALSPFHLAILFGREEVVSWYLARKDWQRQIDRFGNIFHLAACSGQTTIFQLLLSHPAIGNPGDLLSQPHHIEDLTVLAYAAAKNKAWIVYTLLKAYQRDTGLKGRQRHQQDQQALIAAVDYAAVESVQMLLALGVESNFTFDLETKNLSLKGFALRCRKRHQASTKAWQEADEIVTHIDQAASGESENRYKILEIVQRPVRNLVFQGGGIKGIAHVGAYQALCEVLPKAFPEGQGITDIERVAGTSAGAIFAASIALGFNAEQLDILMQNAPFEHFLDDLKPAVLRREGFWEKLKGLIQDMLALKNQLASFTTHPLLYSWGLLNTEGLSKGEIIMGWLSQVFARHLLALRNLPDQKSEIVELIDSICDIKAAAEIELGDIIENGLEERKLLKLTFAQLNRLVELNGAQFKHLFVVALRLKKEGQTEGLEVINSADAKWNEESEWGRVLVIDGIRASMSIPGAFVPHQLRECNQTGQLSVHSQCRYVDGGVLKNYAIELFDKFKYLPNFYHGDDDKPEPNPFTIGFRLYTPDIQPATVEGILGYLKSQVEVLLSNVRDAVEERAAIELLEGLASLYMHAEDIIAEFQNTRAGRTINISNEGIGTLTFSLEDSKRQALMRSGREAVYQAYGQEISQQAQHFQAEEQAKDKEREEEEVSSVPSLRTRVRSQSSLIAQFGLAGNAFGVAKKSRTEAGKGEPSQSKEKEKDDRDEENRDSHKGSKPGFIGGQD